VPVKYLRKAHSLDPDEAGGAIIARFLKTVGASTVAEISWLFSWDKETTERFLRTRTDLVDVEIDIDGSRKSF